jgi:hypothetical protein
MPNQSSRKSSRNSLPNPQKLPESKNAFAASESRLRDLDAFTAAGEDVLVRIIGRITIFGLAVYGFFLFVLRHFFK